MISVQVKGEKYILQPTMDGELFVAELPNLNSSVQALPFSSLFEN